MAKVNMYKLSRRQFTQSTLAVAAVSAFGNVRAQSDEFIEGQHYHLLNDPTPTEGDGVEVREIFWYGCPHCYELEPYMVNWLTKKPEGVNFVREPALFNPSWEFDAKAFYTFEQMEILDQVHQAYYDYLHKDKVRVQDADGLVKFLEPFAVDETVVRDTLVSFGVANTIQKHRITQPKYMIMGVPAVIVNGKYRTGVSDAGSQDRLISLINYLVEKEQQ